MHIIIPDGPIVNNPTANKQRGIDFTAAQFPGPLHSFIAPSGTNFLLRPASDTIQSNLLDGKISDWAVQKYIFIISDLIGIDPIIKLLVHIDCRELITFLEHMIHII